MRVTGFVEHILVILPIALFLAQTPLAKASTIEPMINQPSIASLEFLRDPVWQFIGALIGIAGLFISYQQSTQIKKSLNCILISEETILSVDDSLKDKLKVSYEGNSISNLTSITIEVVNTGNVPIQKNDFDDPLRFRFGNHNLLILDKKIEKENPWTLKDTVKYEVIKDSNNDVIQFEPFLLNRRESFTLKLLISNYQFFLPTYRVIGVTETLRRLLPRKNPSNWYEEAYLKIFAICFLWFSTYSLIRGKEIALNPTTYIYFFAFFGFCTFFVFLYRFIRENQKRFE